MILGFDTLDTAGIKALDPEITLKDIGVTLTKQDLVDAGGKVEPGEPYEEVTSLEDLEELLSGDEPKIYAEIKQDMALTAQDRIVVGANKEVHIKLDNQIDCAKSGFVVEDGGTLILSGEGIVQTSNNSTTGAMIEAKGANAKVIVDGVTLDAITVNGKANNYAYGIYLQNDAEIEFKSGLVKTAYGSCISTNNTTGSAKITISGGELYSDGSYALYIPSQCDVEIKNDAIVQGINARMGNFTIKDNVQIIGTTLTEEDYDNIGKEFATSGCVWLGDTIAVMAGTYTDAHGTNCSFNILDNATVESSFRAAVGIYEVDTKESQNIEITAKESALSTSDAEFQAVMVYDHEYITEQAQAAGKTYEPIAQSVVELNIN